MSDLGKDKIDPTVLQLRDVRMERNIKQKDVAAALGLKTDSSMSAYENGQVAPRVTFVRDWALVLDFDLQLVPIEKPVKGRRRTAQQVDDEIPDDLTTVHLSKYQTALAMGMLIAQAQTCRENSPAMAADLQMVADILARSMH